MRLQRAWWEGLESGKGWELGRMRPGAGPHWDKPWAGPGDRVYQQGADGQGAWGVGRDETCARVYPGGPAAILSCGRALGP